MKKKVLPDNKVPTKRVSIDDLSPEQRQKVMDAWMRLRINLGRAILQANPGLEKKH